MKSLTASVAILCTFGYLCVSCGGAEDARAVLVTDSRGDQAAVRLPVKRIVVLNSDIAEIMRAISAENKIVGVASMRGNCKAFWGRLAELPSVGHAFHPNIERIVQLKPDLVIGIAWRPGPDFDKKMEAFGIQSLRLDCYKPEKVLTEIETLGRIVECEKGAREFVKFLAGIRDGIHNRVRHLPEEKRPAFYTEIYSDYACAASQAGSAQLCVLAGGRNIFTKKVTTHRPRVSAEWVITRNPQVIVRAAGGSHGGGGYGCTDPSGLKAIRDSIVKRPGFEKVDAVKNGRVYVISGDMWLGPSSYITLCYLAKYFHPDLFEDLDPRAVHIEYLRRFHGLHDPGIQSYP